MQMQKHLTDWSQISREEDRLSLKLIENPQEVRN